MALSKSRISAHVSLRLRFTVGTMGLTAEWGRPASQIVIASLVQAHVPHQRVTIKGAWTWVPDLNNVRAAGMVSTCSIATQHHVVVGRTLRRCGTLTSRIVVHG